MACRHWSRTIGVFMTAALGTVPVWGEARALAPNSADRAAFAAFKRLDRENRLSLGAADMATPGAARQVFTILDRDGNGVLTAADGEPARRLLRQSGTRQLAPTQIRPGMAGRMLFALDADEDGRLSLAELRPSLAGNAPLPEVAPPAPSPVVEQPVRPQRCWLHTPQGTWIQLEAWAPKCRLR